MVGGLAGIIGLLDQLDGSLGTLPFSLPGFLTAPPAWVWWLTGYVAIAIGGFVAFYKTHRLLAQWQKKQALADELQKEWSFGLNKLVNADVNTIKKFAKYDFERKAREWDGRVRDIMEKHKCSAQELSHVFELHEIPLTLMPSQEPKINHAVNLVSTRLHRIRDVINSHTITPSTVRIGVLSSSAGAS